MRSGPPTVVLATTNGKGMGHLSRQLALALASLGGMDPVIFSLSTSVSVVGRYDMRAEYAPSMQRHQVARRYWDAYLADRIVTLVREVGASALVFDGVYPYDGVLRALRRMPDVPFIWSRRAMWQKGVGARALRYRRLFAAVLEPGDLAAPGDIGRTVTLDDARRVGPVTLVGHVRALDRDAARAELKLPAEGRTLLLTLGSNKRTNMSEAYRRTVERFTAAGWQVAVTSSPAGARPGDGGPTVINVFPLVRYLNAFDAAVSASGYNAVHELLYSAVPTLLVPNSEAVTDDQRTRSRVVASSGLALSADPERPKEFEAALDRLLDARVRERLIAACRELDLPDGATEAARAVIGLAAGGRPAAGERMDAAALHAQRVFRRQVGRVLPRAVAGWLGRPPRLSDLRGPLSLEARLAPDEGLAVPPNAQGELLVTDALTPSLFDRRWVEHIISGASDDYIAARAEIAARYYRLTGLRLTGAEAERWADLGWRSP